MVVQSLQKAPSREVHWDASVSVAMWDFDWTALHCVVHLPIGARPALNFAEWVRVSN